MFRPINITPIITLLMLVFAGWCHAAPSWPGIMYKIAVDTTGMCQITPGQLKAMGLNDPSKVSVYGFGGVAGCVYDFKDAPADNMPQIPTMVTDDGRVLFYGESSQRSSLLQTSGYMYTRVEENTADVAGYYFVTDHGTPLTVPEVDNPVEGSKITRHYSAVVYSPRVTNPAHAGTYFLSENFALAPERQIDVNFATPDMVESAMVGLRIRGAVKADVPRLKVEFNGSTRLINGVSLAANYDNLESYFDPTNFTTILVRLTEPKDSMPLTVHTREAGRVAYAALESATLTYTRHNRMPDDRSPLSMFLWSSQAGRHIILDNARANTRVWDVTNSLSPVQLLPRLSGDTLDVTTITSHSGSNNFIAFDLDAPARSVRLEQPVTVGRLATLSVPDMVILTAPAYREHAQAIAALHSTYQGLTVEIVEPDEVFNEYSSGTMTPYGVRRFMKSLYDREPGRLKHLLLLGSATYDPAGHVTGETHPLTHIVTYETEEFKYQGDAVRCFCNDAFFGFLDDKVPDYMMASEMSINVGRIPAATQAQADDYLAKITNYMTQGRQVDAYSHAVVIGDYGDRNGHLIQADQLADSIAAWNEHTTVTKLMLSLYPADSNGKTPRLDRLKKAFHDGIGFLSYSGHGSTSTIGSDRFVNRTTVNDLVGDSYPFVMLSTCYSLGYDRAQTGISEMLLFNRNGGSLVGVGSGRSVQMLYNQYLNLALGEEYFHIAPNGTMGDVYRRARNSIVTTYSSIDLVTNTSCYNFIGDPALPVYTSTHSVALHESMPKIITVTPLSNNVIRGTVLNSDGSIAHDFNGRMNIKLYEPQRSDMTSYDPQYYNSRNQASPIEVLRRETVAADAEGNIVNGEFSIQLHCPQLDHRGEGYRLSFHAMSATDNNRALNTTHRVVLAETPDSPELDDGIAPEITSLYINTPDFKDGDVVDADIIVYAEIVASLSGISRTEALDRMHTITIDNTRYSDLSRHIEHNDDGTATLAYSIKGLSGGNHRLTLSIVDNASNHRSQSLTFRVINTPATAILSVTEETVTQQAELILTHDMDSQPDMHLVITDNDGNTVHTARNAQFPYVWNLTDDNGDYVPDGYYAATAYLRSGFRYAAARAKMVVVK